MSAARTCQQLKPAGVANVVCRYTRLHQSQGGQCHNPESRGGGEGGRGGITMTVKYIERVDNHRDESCCRYYCIETEQYQSATMSPETLLLGVGSWLITWAVGKYLPRYLFDLHGALHLFIARCACFSHLWHRAHCIYCVRVNVCVQCTVFADHLLHNIFIFIQNHHMPPFLQDSAVLTD